MQVSTTSKTQRGFDLPVAQQIDLFYDKNNSEQSARDLVFALRPNWQIEPGEIEITKFTDGITNILLKLAKKGRNASQAEVDRDSILMRSYGEDTHILIDRDREASSHKLLAERDLAPALLARFNNGLLYRYVPGQVCKPEDLACEPIWRAVAKRLAEWHACLPIESVLKAGILKKTASPCSSMHSEISTSPSLIDTRSPSPNIWGTLQAWVLALPSGTTQEVARKEQLQKELEQSFLELDSQQNLGDRGLVLGHCDLLSSNIIIVPGSNSMSTEDVAFIDYEYATACPAAFDIANHFAEWAGFDCNYNLLPSREVRRNFLFEYLSSYNSYSKQTLGPGTLEQLCNDIDRYRGMPGLYWGVWALIQAGISKIDFPYAAYAETRLSEYFAWRAEEEGTRQGEIPVREKRWAQQV